MKNIIIYGAGNKGVFLSRLLKNKTHLLEEKFNILYFCDTYKEAGSYVEGIEIISPEQLEQIEYKIDFIVISSNDYAEAIQSNLIALKISTKVYVIPEYVYKFMWKSFDDKLDMPFLLSVDLNKPRMPYLEIMIVDHCNLNCKACSALANIKEPKYLDLEEFELSMKRLKELFWGIKYLKLFGGKPLLHPKLKEFLTVARMHFPDSKLVVHSNGLLIPKMDDNLFKVMREKNIQFEFTQYPPTGTKKRQIIKKLEENGLEYRFREPLYEFRKPVNIHGDYEEKEVYKTCCKCINLIQGTLSCGFGWMLKGLEDLYGTVICDDKFQHCINIFDTDLNGWEINTVLDSPFNLCKYCSFMNVTDIDERTMEWKCGGPYKLEDWVYDRNVSDTQN